jgi:hypothetical protein
MLICFCKLYLPKMGGGFDNFVDHKWELSRFSVCLTDRLSPRIEVPLKAGESDPQCIQGGYNRKKSIQLSDG